MALNGVKGESNDSSELWRHPHPESPEFYAFQQHVAKKHGAPTSSYQDLWQWSIDHPDTFWEEVWHYTGIKANKQYDVGTRVTDKTAQRTLILLVDGPRHFCSHVS